MSNLCVFNLSPCENLMGTLAALQRPVNAETFSFCGKPAFTAMTIRKLLVELCSLPVPSSAKRCHSFFSYCLWCEQKTCPRRRFRQDALGSAAVMPGPKCLCPMHRKYSQNNNFWTFSPIKETFPIIVDYIHVLMLIPRWHRRKLTSSVYPKCPF